MKKAIGSLFLLALLAACNSNGKTKSGGDTTGGPSMTNVENVNGNVPDTTNSMQLSTSDSTGR